MKLLIAFIKKELLQIMRDPSSIIISFVLPLISILIYMYGINMDTPRITLGIKNDDSNPEVESLITSFSPSDYVKTVLYKDKDALSDDIVRSRINGGLFIPQDFSRRLSQGKPAQVLIVTDGSEVNTANYVQNYTSQILNDYAYSSRFAVRGRTPAVVTQVRYWYNQDLNSHNFILPGSIAITMTLIGILLTALVVAREWERGTMEALLSTKIHRIHIVLGKYIPYFILGMLSMAFNVFVCIVVFNVPFRGNMVLLFAISGLFLFTCLGIGLLISTRLRNQFLASEISIAIGFLPALLLSGLVFPIASMPKPFRILTMILPQRHYVEFIESEFLAGTVTEIVVRNTLFLSGLGLFLFVLVYRSTRMRLEK